MCRFATLLSTETAAKDALLLTGSKKHPTQFSFSSRLRWNSRFHVEAQLEFRTLRIVHRRAPVVLFESNQEPKSDFHQTTHFRLLLATMDTPEGDPHGASFFSVSGGSDGNLSYNSVSCAQISSEVRHYCVFDETHCSTDVCYGGFLAVEATLFQPIPDTPIAKLLLPIHGFSTTDCRESGPRRTCLSSSTVSLRPSFAPIWGLHSYPSCDTPEVSIEVYVESWFATFASTSSHLDEKVRSFVTDTDSASH